MPIVQDPESATNDPRWILLRASKINLLLSAVGILLSFAVLTLVPLPGWLRVGLGVVFFAGFLWDLHLILLKGFRSVNAFYLFDLDVAPDQDDKSQASAKLGIHMRYSGNSGLPSMREAQGVIMNGAFVSPWFTAVRYVLSQDPRWRKWWPHIIPIWPDSIAADAFRRVRVALKWK